MAQSPASDGERPLEDILVVDSDVHVIARDPDIAEQVADKLDDPYRDRHHPHTGEGGFRFPSLAGTGARIPGKISVFGHTTLVDPEQGIEQELRTDLGVDHPILNITPLWDQYPDTEQGRQEMPATNDILIQEFLDYSDDYFGMISVPMRDPDAAVAEIDRLGDEDQMVGVMIHPGGQERGLGDPRYDPIWEATEDNDLAAAFHTTATGFMWQMPGIFSEMPTMVESHALSHPWTMMWAATSLVVNGVPEKFPDLEWVFLEAGIGWLPIMISRLNREYRKRPESFPNVDRTPEEMIRDQFYISTQPLSEFQRVARMREIIDTLGSEMIMFSSDHPHFDFDNPESIRGFFNHLEREEQERVFNQNAIDVFDLPI